MSLLTLIYLAEVVGKINVITFVMVISVPIVLMLYHMFVENRFGNDDDKRYYKHIIVTGLAALIIAVLTPSERTVYLMAGSKYAEEIAASPAAKQVYDKVHNIIMDKLDKLSKGK